MSEPASIREQKMVMNVYGALLASLLLSFIPEISFALVAMLFFFGVLVIATIIRSDAHPDSLTVNHMTWIIRTIWLACLFSVATIPAGGVYLWTHLDFSEIESCSLKASNYINSQNQNLSPLELWSFLDPCAGPFLKHNWELIVAAGFITLLPITVFLTIRLAKGISRAAKGFQLANAESLI